MTERWAIVPETSSRYSVSTYGRVRREVASCHGPGGSLLSISTTKDGYRRVTLYRGCTGVHRLVLATFVGPCPKGKECHHKNGVRNDNRLDNLEWITRSENLRIAYRAGAAVPKRGNAKLNEAEIRLIRKTRGRKIPQAWLGRWFKVHQSQISCIQTGTCWGGMYATA